MKKNYTVVGLGKVMRLYPFLTAIIFAGLILQSGKSNAQCTPRSLPFTETWNANSFSTCTPTTGGWVAQGTGAHINQDGGVGEEANNISCSPGPCEGSSYPDLAFYGDQCYPEAATLRAYSPPINTAGSSSVTFSFVDYYFSGSASALINMEVQTSTDLVNWHQVWQQTGGVNDIDGSAGVSFTISNADLNNGSTYFAFYLSSNELCFLNDWWIDNISIVGLATPAITGFTPSSGCAGTQSITITGTNLSGATSVTIGGTPVQSITSNTSTQIVVVVGSGTTGVISVTTPNGTTSSSTSFTVNTAPATPGTISCPTTVCSGATNTYAINPVNGAISYTWTLPNGWSGTSTTTNIAATQATGGGNITVIANNACGSSSAQTLTVTLGSAPATPAIILGPDSVCDGSTNTFSVATVAGATSYIWTLPNGWTGTSTTNTISATEGTGAGTISVTANNDCGSSVAQTSSVTLASAPATPGNILGPVSVCDASTNTFWVNQVAGATSYTWTLPNGWSGTSTTNTISATEGTGGGNISVTANNDCGSSTAQTLNVSLQPVPAEPAAILGPDSSCAGVQNTFAIATVNGATNYTWTLPNGWTGTSTTESIVALTNSTGGVISVTANNDCGASTAQAFNVTINPDPQVSFVFTANPVCDNTPVPLNTGTPAGGTYSGTGVIAGNFDATGLATGNYVVTYSYSTINGCSGSDSSTVIVSVCTGVTEISELQIEAYPNPFADQLIIKNNGNYTNAKAVLTDAIGRTLATAELNTTTTQINTTELTKGAYLLNIVAGGKILTVKKLIRVE